MNICKICDKKIALSYKLKCNHTFCFLCIKTHYLNKYQRCPTCYRNIDSLSPSYIKNYDINFEDGFIWVYSSNFSTYWWCYDSESNKQIELIYNDYLARMKIVEKNLDFDIYYDNKSTSDAKENKNDIWFDDFTPILVDDSDNSRKIDCVNFTQHNNFDAITTIFNTNNDNDLSKKKEMLSYVLNIGTSKYRIDFDMMTQINTDNPSKKRSIKRIKIDESTNDIIPYLKNNMNVLGVAGIKF